MDARISCRWMTSIVVVVALGAAGGCATQSSTEVVARPTGHGPVELRVDPCVDRTATKSRDVAADATEALIQKLRASSEFVVKDDARYRLGCEVTSFVEGSAFQRWILPGWGATVGQIAVMVTDTRTGAVDFIARGNATVAAGGLYTIGAETYIVGTAAGDVVEQLRKWAAGAAR